VLGAQSWICEIFPGVKLRRQRADRGGVWGRVSRSPLGRGLREKVLVFVLKMVSFGVF